MKSLLTLSLASLIAFTACNEDKKKKPAEKPGITDQSKDVSFQGFMGRLRTAVAKRDMQVLASMMTSNFGYRLDVAPPQGEGAGVFQYWDENNIWPELQLVLGEKFVPKGFFMVAPKEFADENIDYHGYRAGIQLVNGSWKFAYFVKG